MSGMSIIVDHVKALIAANTALAAALPPGYLQIGAPLSYPSVCIDGMIANDDKQEVYDFNINLWAAGTNSGAEKLAFYELTDTLKDILGNSNLILGGNWLDRSEVNATTGTSVLRAMYPCRAYLANAL